MALYNSAEPLFSRKNVLIAGAQDIPQQNDLIGVQMALPYLDLRHRAAGDIAAAQLQLRGHPLLRKPRLFPQLADVVPDTLLHLRIDARHLLQKCTHMGAKLLDIIIGRWYDYFAPI